MKRSIIVALALVVLSVASVTAEDLTVSVAELPSEIVTEVTLKDNAGNTVDVLVLNLPGLSENRDVVLRDIIATIEVVVQAMEADPSLSVADLQEVARNHLMDDRGWAPSAAEIVIKAVTGIVGPILNLF